MSPLLPVLPITVTETTVDDHAVRDLAEAAVELAAEILQHSQSRTTPAEWRKQRQVASLIDDPAGKAFTLTLVDEVLRITDERRAADHLSALIRRYGLPQSFSRIDRWLIKTGAAVARWLPKLVMPLIRRRIQHDSAHVIISAEAARFADYLRQRKASGVRVNVNQLGEAVLGEHEANRQLETCIARLHEDEIDYVSVKLSAITSQISLTGYADTVDRIRERLRRLFRAAMRSDGPDKFVNLDMEEYRDLQLTVDVFRLILDEPEFHQFSAGIVLQAYLPDSFAVQRSLTDWARRRVADGGAGIKIRLVKGANLAMERVEASLHGWSQAPYSSKTESDANFKRMLEYACRPENAEAVRIGIASHNLFDIALALLLTEQRRVQQHVDFEMLEGMANSQLRELLGRTGDLLVYAPVCFDAHFDAAVAYLVRRFDENTQPGSFLSSLFTLQVDSPAWNQQRDMFVQACELAASSTLAAKPRRSQSRATEEIQASDRDTPFSNAADTDFSLPENREWIRAVVEHSRDATYQDIPLQICGQEITTSDLETGYDPSRPGRKLYQFSRGDRTHVTAALTTAVQACPAWEAKGLAERAAILREFAAVSGRQRGETIGIMMADSGKAAAECDTEISEAIDFAEYYSRSLNAEDWHDGTTSTPAGTVVVTPPWNFPYAIPAGGCLAALMAGNSVILKPAPETVLTGWHLACQLWQAGVPRHVLQFLPLPDDEEGRSLICDSRVDIVVLTGAWETAQLFQSWRPDLRLYAETSGKNSLIITATADLDLAIRDLVKGAFGHAGQKCSATSLALVERSVYESAQFRSQLRDAAASQCVSSAWNLAADVTPIIGPPHAALMRGLTQLDEGESWLLKPSVDDSNPCLWSPGVRLGVQSGSWFHRTECFGPVLGIMPFNTLDDAIAIQNHSQFGLTGGIHALDPSEIDQWREAVEVGNAYINRSTTGAIVQRQPFGGWKNSAVGPGAKAGGPNYVASFRNWQPSPRHTATVARSPQPLLSRMAELLPSKQAQADFLTAAESYEHWWTSYFSLEHDPSRLHGEDNHLRYRPMPIVNAFVTEDSEDLLNVLKIVTLCRIARIPLTVYAARLPAWAEGFQHETGLTVQQASVADFCTTATVTKTGTVRVFDNDPPQQIHELRSKGVRVTTGPCLSNGRLEWLHVLREQSITQTTHRHGNLREATDQARSWCHPATRTDNAKQKRVAASSL